MQRQFIFGAIIALAMHVGAIEIETTAGALSSDLQDLTATSLTVKGTMDARDFKFIAEQMTQLTELDLSQADIVAFSDPTASLASSITSYPARTLPHAMLMGTGLTHLVLPSNLEGIGQAALAGCENLTSIQLPEGLTTLGAYAFSHTGLTTIGLPSTLTSIGDGAFSRCDALESITINCAQVGNAAFLGATHLSNVTLGDAVTTIGNSAFNGCTALTSITLGDNCQITTIGTEAFAGSGLTTIDLTAMPQLTTIGPWAFTRTPLQQITVPETVTSLGEGAFYYTQQLTQATIPALTKLADYAFAGNNLLNTPQILPQGTEHIGDYAFYGATAMETFVLPASVTYIGTRAMAGMTALTQIDVLGDVATLGDSVWAGVNQPAVRLDTRRDNDVSNLFAQADQWKDFHIMLDYLLGDANDDSRVNVLDITTTVDYIQDYTPEVFVFPAANVHNDDEEINVLDITGMVDIIMEKEYTTIRAAKGKGPMAGMLTTEDQLAITGLNLTAGQTITVPVELRNDATYNAMQCDITLSEGLELASEQPALTDRTAHHTVAMNRRDDGTYRIVLFSMDNDVIAGNDGAVLLLEVKATHDVSHASNILVDNVFFADRQHDYRAMSTQTYVDNTITGVNDMHDNLIKAWGSNGTIIIEAQEATTAQLVSASGIATVVNVTPGINQYPVTSGIYMVRVNGTTFKVIAN